MNVKLIHGDCLEEMPKLIKDGVKVDLVLTDLPYGTTRNKWDAIIPFNEMWDCINNLSYNTTPSILFSQMPFTISLANSNIENLRYEWIWQKEQGTGYLNSKRMPLKIHENILVFYKKLPYYNPQMNGNKKRVVKRNPNKPNTTNYGKHIRIAEAHYTGRHPIDIIKFNKDKQKVHPTQKPVRLLEYLIKTYTRPRDTVLDFTMGSGSTGVACINTNRNFIGIELDPKYYQIAVDRINETKKQTKLII